MSELRRRKEMFEFMIRELNDKQRDFVHILLDDANHSKQRGVEVFLIDIEDPVWQSLTNDQQIFIEKYLKEVVEFERVGVL